MIAAPFVYEAPQTVDEAVRLRGSGPGAVIAGLLLHQGGPSIFWALVFGAIVHASRASGTPRLLAIGAVVGIASQLVDVNLLLPPIMRVLHGHDIWAAEVPAHFSWAAHLVFGVVMGLLYTRVATAVRRPHA